MSREIRRVPIKWEHPKKANGVFQPLNANYVGTLKYYLESVETFIKSMTEVIENGKTILYEKEWKDSYALYDYLTEDGIKPPDIREYMPSGIWFQLYEGVSEGTPLSPAFSTKEELIEWLSTNKDYWGTQWTKEQAEKMLKV